MHKDWYPAACLNQVNLPRCSLSGSSSILPLTLARWPCCTAILFAAHLNQVDLLRCDVAALSGQARLRAHTVVMNPPFGTRQKGADIDFLRAAFRVPPRLRLRRLLYHKDVMSVWCFASRSA